MKVTKAYKLIIKSSKTIPYVKMCKDFGDFYGFFLAPLQVCPDDTYYVGTIMTAVDKRTGKIFDYDITKDMSKFRKAKTINVRSGLGLKVSEIKKTLIVEDARGD